MPPITRFDGAHRFLSNFYPVLILYGGATYETLEHAYQSQKTLAPAERDRVNFHRSTTLFEGQTYSHVRATTPGEAKRAGRKVTLRPEWELVKLPLMAELLGIKFAYPTLRAWLADTGAAELIEGNHWHDTTFGVCHCPAHGGAGLNHLGKMLMHLRRQLYPICAE